MRGTPYPLKLKQDIYVDFTNGMKTSKIADKYHMRPEIVRNIISHQRMIANGKPIVEPKYNKEITAQVLEMYRNGKLCADISHETGIPIASVKGIIGGNQHKTYYGGTTA